MDPFQKHYDRVLRFLSFRPRSEKEIRDYLKRPPRKRFPSKQKPIDEEVVEKIIAKLKEYKFVDDEEFTRWWIEQRTGAKPKGARVIKMELQQKGIDREHIERLLSTEEIKKLGNEGIRKLIEKHYPKYANLPKQEIRQKLGQFLLRRGFDWDSVKPAIDHVTSTDGKR